MQKEALEKYFELATIENDRFAKSQDDYKKDENETWHYCEYEIELQKPDNSVESLTLNAELKITYVGDCVIFEGHGSDEFWLLRCEDILSISGTA